MRGKFHYVEDSCVQLAGMYNKGGTLLEERRARGEGCFSEGIVRVIRKRGDE